MVVDYWLAISYGRQSAEQSGQRSEAFETLDAIVELQELATGFEVSAMMGSASDMDVLVRRFDVQTGLIQSHLDPHELEMLESVFERGSRAVAAVREQVEAGASHETLLPEFIDIQAAVSGLAEVIHRRVEEVLLDSLESQEDAEYWEPILSGMFWILSISLTFVAVSFGRQRGREDRERERLLTEAVTESARVVSALRASEERFQCAVDGSADALWDYDPASGLCWVSDRFREFLRLRPDEPLVSLEDWMERVHPEDIEAHRSALKAHFEERKPYAIESRLKTVDGGYRWFRTKGQAVWDTEGEPRRMSGSVSDIHDIKLIELELQRSRELLVMSARMAQIGGWELDIENESLNWSKEVRRIHEVPEDYRPRVDSAIDFYVPEARPVIRSAVERAIESGEPFDEVLGLRTWTGRNIWVRAKGEAEWSQGRVIRLMGLFQNVTEQKRNELELEEARERAVAANEAKSAFLANMSHEIRTPIAGIIGMTNLILDTPLDLEQAECARTVEICGKQLLTLVNDILDFSKIESQHIELESIEFDLSSVVEDAIEIVRGPADSKGLDISALVGATVPVRATGDPGRLRQILVNLMNNAIKFTEHGAVLLRVNRDSQDGSRLRFSIEDTGIGIPKNRLDRLFRPFSQVDASTTRRYGGTGLGLVISKRLVELMGGDVWVHSSEGAGSTFEFTARFEKPQLPSEDHLARISALRVLIVERDPEPLRRLLDVWGCSTRIVESAASARTLIEKEGASFDLAFLGASSAELEETERLRSLPGLADAIWIRMARTSDLDPSVGQDTVDLVLQPLKQSRVLRCLQRACGLATAAEDDQLRHPKGQLVADLSSLRILLAEDNRVNQIVALRLLEKKLGCRAEVANNGLEALELLAVSDFDLVLMDCQMPEVDGYEATRRIRGGEHGVRNPSIPVIAMTANALKGDREKCLAAGMDDYVTKPVDLERLVDVVRRVLDREPPTEAPPRGPSPC